MQVAMEEALTANLLYDLTKRKHLRKEQQIMTTQPHARALIIVKQSPV